MYAFFFDRRSLLIFATSAFAVGVLLFLAGLTAGARLNLPASAGDRSAPSEGAPGSGSLPGGSPLAGPGTSPAEQGPSGSGEAVVMQQGLDSADTDDFSYLQQQLSSTIPDNKTPEHATPEHTTPEHRVLYATVPENTLPSTGSGAALGESRGSSEGLAQQRTVPEKEAPSAVRALDSPAYVELVAGESAGSPRRYAVRAGAYSVEENAHRQIHLLKELGYPATLDEHARRNGTKWFTVTLGEFDGRDEATALALRFIESERRTNIVTAEH